MEAQGTRVRYLNIGDPIAFGFETPPHLVAAVERAMRDGHNGYGPSAGIAPAREAVAEEFTSRGFPVSSDRVFITAGTSEAIDIALAALVDEQGEVLVPMPTYPLYTAVLAKLGTRARYYQCDPARGWAPDVEEVRRLVTPATRAIVVIDPNNPDRRLVFDGDSTRAHRRRGAARPRHPGRRGLRRSRLRRPGGVDGQPRPRRGDHCLFEPVEGVPRARLAHRLDGHRPLAPAERRGRGGGEADRRTAVQHRADAVRRRRGAARRPVASDHVPGRAEGARDDRPPTASMRCRASRA